MTYEYFFNKKSLKNQLTEKVPQTNLWTYYTDRRFSAKGWKQL